jgi:hypothetical protein
MPTSSRCRADKIRNIEPVAVLFEGRVVHGTLK